MSGLRVSAQRRLSAVRVLIALTDQGVTCAWLSKGQWHWVDASWPEGACVNGRPQQPEAIADLVADLLLDIGLLGARIELLLPLELCEWRVLDGLGGSRGAPLDRAVLLALPWRFSGDDCYVSCCDCSGSTLAIAASRVDLQAWIDVFEQADLPLDRVDWLLSSACLGLLELTSQRDVDLAWMIGTSRWTRVLLIRNGVPEVDRVIKNDPSDRGLVELVGTIEAWRLLGESSRPLRWLSSWSPSAPPPPIALTQWVDETAVSLDLPSVAFRPWDASTDADLLDPLVSLGFSGLGLVR